MRRREPRRRRRSFQRGSGGVNLISMMDILTVLLLFLLKSYAPGVVMTPAAGVRLPTSTAEQPPQSSVIVAIDSTGVRVDDQRVATLAELREGPALEIGSLSARLQTMRRHQRKTAKQQPLVATIQGDRDIEFRALQKVMFTLHRNGYEDIALAVIQKS